MKKKFVFIYIIVATMAHQLSAQNGLYLNGNLLTSDPQTPYTNQISLTSNSTITQVGPGKYSLNGTIGNTSGAIFSVTLDLSPGDTIIFGWPNNLYQGATIIPEGVVLQAADMKSVSSHITGDGTLLVTGGDIDVVGVNDSLDMRDLQYFDYQAGGSVEVGVDGPTSGTNSFYLAKNSKITASQVDVCGANTIGTSTNSYLYLGSVSNVIYADYIYVGILSRKNATILAKGYIVSTGNSSTLKIRGTDGVGRTHLRVGWKEVRTYTSRVFGYFHVEGATVDMLLSYLHIAYTAPNNQGKAAYGSFKFSEGMVDAPTLTVASHYSTALAYGTTVGEFSLNGSGTVKASLLRLGYHRSNATLTLSGGGTIQVENLTEGASPHTISSDLIWNEGTITNYDGSTDATITVDTISSNTTSDHIFSPLPNRTITVSSTIQGSGNIIQDGTDGVTILNRSNLYTGKTIVKNGTLQASSSVATNAFGDKSWVYLDNTAGATLDLNDANQTIGSLFGGGNSGGYVNLGTGTLTIDSDTTATYSGRLAESGALEKLGTGVQILENNHTFTGAVSVLGGELRVDGTLASPSAVTVTGALLSGGGSVASSVTVSDVAGSKIQGGSGVHDVGGLSTGLINLGGSISKIIVNTNGVDAVSTISSTGAVTLQNAVVDVTSELNSGSYVILSGTSISGVAALGSLPANGCYSLQVISTDLVLVVDNPDISPHRYLCIDEEKTLTISGTLATVDTWSSADANIVQITSGGVIKGISQGTTYITCLVTNGCRDTLNVTVSGPSTVTASPSQLTLCAGDDLSLNGSASGGEEPYTYAWSGPNGYTSSQDTSVIANISSLGSGQYSLTVTDASGCPSNPVSTAQITVYASLTVSTSSTQSACEGDDVTLVSTPSGGSGTYTQYSWTGPNGYINDQQSPVISNIALVSAGTYSVTVMDDNSCSSQTPGSIVLTVNELPDINVSASLNEVCEGNGVALSSTPSGGSGNYTSYAWTGPSGFTSSARDTTIVSVSANGAGDYQARVLDDQGCWSSGSSVTISVNQTPTVSVSASSLTLCEGDTLGLGGVPSSGSGTYVTYSWTGPNNFSAAILEPSIQSITTAGSGKYSLTVVDDKGCSSVAANTDSVAVYSLPAVTLSLSMDSLCENQNLIISTAVSGGSGSYVLYDWTGPGGFTSSASEVSIFEITHDHAGRYSVQVTDDSGCRSPIVNTDPVVILESPTVSLSDTLVGICSGDTLSVQSTVTGGTGSYTYIWSGPDNYRNFTANLLITPVTEQQVGTYVLHVADNNGCEVRGGDTVRVVTSNPPSVLASITSGKVCANQNVSLLAAASGGSGNYVTYRWTGPNDFSESSNLPTIEIFSVTPSDEGVYEVSVIDDTGCVSNVHQISLPGVVASPIINTSSFQICEGSTIQLTASLPGSTWTSLNPDTVSVNQNGLVQGQSEGIGSILFTSDEGCSAEKIIVVRPTPSITSKSLAVCSGEAFKVSLQDGVDGDEVPSNVSYSWEKPDSVGVSGLSAGTDESEIKDTLINLTTSSKEVRYDVVPKVGLCSGSSFPIVITLNPAPAVQSIVVDSICSGDSFSVVPVGGTHGEIPSNTRYFYDPPTGTPTGGQAGVNKDAISSLSLSQSGNTVANSVYHVTPVSGTCIGKNFTLSVPVKPIPSVSLNYLAFPVCSGSTAAIGFISSVSNTTYTWTSEHDDGILQSSSNPTPVPGPIVDTLVNTSDQPAKVRYSITPSYRSCRAANPLAAEVTVNPSPSTVVGETSGTENYCSGQTTNIRLSSNKENTKFLWAVTATSTISGWSNNTNTPYAGPISQILISTSSIIEKVTYAVSPVDNTCLGTVSLADVFIMPRAEVEALDVTLCSGTSTDIDLINLKQMDSILYTWKVIDSSSNEVTGFSDQIEKIPTSSISQTLVSSSLVNQTITYEITPYAYGCLGLLTTVEAHINPAPQGAVEPNQLALCSGDETQLQLSFTRQVPGSTFVWTVSSTDQGASPESVGSAGPIVQRLVNTTHQPIVNTYSIVPKSNGCSGEEITASVTINPYPTIGLTNNPHPKVCDEGSTNIRFVSTVDGTTISWVAENPQGHAEGYSNSTAPQNFSIIQKLTSDVGSNTVRYLITPDYKGCQGEPIATVVPVSVISAPLTSDIEDIEICSGKSIAVNFNDVNEVFYRWTADASYTVQGQSEQLLLDSLVRSVQDTLTTSANYADTVTYTVVPTSSSCIGKVDMFNVVVNPIPVMNFESERISLCSGEAKTIELVSSITSPGVLYKWTVSPVGKGNPSSENGSAGPLVVQLTNNSMVDEEITYSITPIFKSCEGPQVDQKILLRKELQAPSIEISSSNHVCEGDTVSLISQLIEGEGVKYQWFRNNTLLDTIDQNNTYTIHGALSEHTGRYKVFLVDQCNINGISSDGVDLIVSKDAYFEQVKATVAPTVGLYNQKIKYSYEGPTDQVTYMWDFGDTTFVSNEKTIQHIYYKEGKFFPKLRVERSNNSLCFKEVNLPTVTILADNTVISTGDIDIEILGLRIYPIPMHDYVMVESKHQLKSVYISDIQGQVVFRKSAAGEISTRVNTSQLVKGAYILTIIDNMGTKNIKVTKN